MAKRTGHGGEDRIEEGRRNYVAGSERLGVHPEVAERRGYAWAETERKKRKK